MYITIDKLTSSVSTPPPPCAHQLSRFEIYGLIFEKFMDVSQTITDYLSDDWEALRQYEIGDEEETENKEEMQQEKRDEQGIRSILSSSPKPSSPPSSFSSLFSSFFSFLFPSPISSSSTFPSSSSSATTTSSTSLLKIAVHLRHRSIRMNITSFDTHFAGQINVPNTS